MPKSDKHITKKEELKKNCRPVSRMNTHANTSVLSYFIILVCVCVQSLNHVLLFATPWTVARQAPLSMRFSRQEYRNGAIPSSRGSSCPRDWTHVSCVSCIGRHILYPLFHLATPYIISVSQPKYPLGLCPPLCLSCPLHPLATPQRRKQDRLCLGSLGWIHLAAPAQSIQQLTGLSVFTVSTWWKNAFSTWWWYARVSSPESRSRVCPSFFTVLQWNTQHLLSVGSQPKWPRADITHSCRY